VVDLLADRPDLVEVDLQGQRRTVNVGLLGHEVVAPGSWVLIHMGFALSTIDEEEARDALEFLSEGFGDPDDVDHLRAASAAAAWES
jgi:hydrogenase expression/formation protein HypC